MEQKLYKLTQSQSLLYLGMKYTKAKQILNIALELEIKNEVDLHFLMQATTLAALRNPSNQVRFIKRGKDTFQYFSNEAQEKIDYFEFNNEDAYQKYLKQFAETPFPNKSMECQLYRLAVIKKPNGLLAICGCFNHLIYDAYSSAMFFREILGIYRSLVNNEPLPAESFSPIPAYEADEKYLNSKRYQIDLDYFTKEFSTVPHYSVLSGRKSPSFPKKGRFGLVWFFFQPNFKADTLVFKIDNELIERVNNYASANKISPQCVYAFALRTYLAWVCQIDDVTFETTINRRSTVVQKRAGGNMSNSSRLRTVHGDDISFKAGLKMVYEVFMERYKHSDFSIETLSPLCEKLYGIKQYECYDSCLFTYQSPTVLDDEIEYELKRVPNGHEWMPLYMSIMPYNSKNEYIADYSYMPNIIKESDIRKFHQFMLDYIAMGIENDELIIKDIIEKVGK